MPTYDYQCRQCGRITEVIHAMTEDGPTTCEFCGGQLRRVLYPAGIIFKGSGFYKTDSRGSSSASVATSTDGGAGGATTPSGSKEGSSGSKESSKGGSTSGESAGTGPAKSAPEKPSGGKAAASES